MTTKTNHDATQAAGLKVNLESTSNGGWIGPLPFQKVT